jgi:stage IV sporulation protein FB
MRFVENTLEVGRLGGVPLRFHVSILALPILKFVLGWSAVGALASLGIILAHELGHAAVVRMAGARPLNIVLTAFGGWCAWQGGAGPIGRACIAWGGVWAQLLILAASLLFEPMGPVSAELIATAQGWNVSVLLLNLIPLKPLDGAEAWGLPWLLGRAVRARLGRRRRPVVVDPTFGLEPNDEAKRIAAQLLRDAREPKP